MTKKILNNNLFFESGKTIYFYETTNVIKFDEHRFYKYVSGRGLKGVDFIVLDPVVGLILIEIKNFIDYANQPSKEKIAAEFYRKCEDTLRLIEVINSYYKRKWWFKVMTNLKLQRLFSNEIKNWLIAFEFYKDNKIKLIGDFELKRLD